MKKAKESLIILQSTLQGVNFTEKTTPTDVMDLTTDFIENDTSFKQVYA